jgi:DNA-binding response OmpR family regulator
VFLTARTQENNEYLDLGADGVIAKPFEPGSLVEQVRAYTRELAAA